ncbi:MAG: hypothetical protein AAFO76_13530 [Cyanobacteria bacterium J06607_15]
MASVLVSIPLRLTANGANAPASRSDFASIEAVGLTALREQIYLAETLLISQTKQIPT